MASGCSYGSASRRQLCVPLGWWVFYSVRAAATTELRVPTVRKSEKHWGPYF